MEFSELIAKLRHRLESDLPGRNAQLLMSSYSSAINSVLFSKLSKKSSVLLLLYPDGESINTVLIQRPKYAGVHSGQISFPGGKHEKDDVDFSYTAIRETYEEVGVEMSSIHLIGQLTELYIPPSNFMVYPFVGYTNEKPKFKPDNTEVSKIIHVNIFDFLDEKNVILNGEIMVRFGIKLKIPYYKIEDNIIWGATAMIMSEFVEIIKLINDQN
jgi:8-oxo-dGTP pyrophosphatase MutT (NUDIX family)